MFFCCDYNYSKLVQHSPECCILPKKQKPNKKTYKPNKKYIYNHKEIYINFHKQKVKGLEQNGMQLFVKEF